ncbi:hypothetical protein BMS3Abin09_00306 [bacterium BMS3Abin09]|nr:hypothetical protein BMS3Abin09_00306 [bacterium BMS3Abin09]
MTSRSVIKSPDLFDILTGSPFLRSDTIWISITVNFSFGRSNASSTDLILGI